MLKNISRNMIFILAYVYNLLYYYYIIINNACKIDNRIEMLILIFTKIIYYRLTVKRIAYESRIASIKKYISNCRPVRRIHMCT